MLRSLYSGVSGLRTHQLRMDVLGDNVANVNTTGFKRASATFKDVFYQVLRGGSESNADLGVPTHNRSVSGSPGRGGGGAHAGAAATGKGQI